MDKSDNPRYCLNIEPPQRIFLLSHMRANTSLISHILGSHAQISGYYEMHLSYQKTADLIRQQQCYAAKDMLKPAGTYLFDKLLHNKYDLYLDKLDSPAIKVLVSIREPAQTIKSIINLFAKKEQPHPYAEAAKATDYYIKRLQYLENFCTQYKQQYYYFDADIIRLQPETSLNALQKYLSLSTPLSEHYQIFSQTGQAGAGDSSENMKEGKIVYQQSNYEQIIISGDLLSAARAQYHRLRPLIINHARAALTL